MADSSISTLTYSNSSRGDLGLATTDSPEFTAINLGHASDTTLTRSAAGVVQVEGKTLVNLTDGGTFAADISVPDEAYGAGWNGSVEVPTKNAVYDKIETLGSAGANTALSNLASVAINTTLVSDTYNTDALGTSAIAWSDLFLGNGAVIDFSSAASTSDVTITHSSNKLAIAGGTLELPAVTTTVAPLKFATGGTLLTTPEDGAIEMDDNCFYGTVDAGNRGYIPVRHFIRANVANNLSNSGSEQKLFSNPTNGTLTLETGLYYFKGILDVKTMSASSGNAAIDILGAGTATCGSWLWCGWGRDAGQAVGAVSGMSNITQQSGSSIVTGGTATEMWVSIEGTFEVTVAGTIIPSITLLNANAAVVAVGSFISFERMGSDSVVSVGQWT